MPDKMNSDYLKLLYCEFQKYEIMTMSVVGVQPKRHANHKPIKHTLLRGYIDRKKAGNWVPTCIAAAYRRLPS